MCTTIDVEHFARYLASPTEIEHGVGDVLDIYMLPSGDKEFRKSFGSFLCIGVSTIPGATAFLPSNADEWSKCYSMRWFRRIAVRTNMRQRNC
jgi:hypothetical protein